MKIGNFSVKIDDRSDGTIDVPGDGNRTVLGWGRAPLKMYLFSDITAEMNIDTYNRLLYWFDHTDMERFDEPN